MQKIDHLIAKLENAVIIILIAIMIIIIVAQVLFRSIFENPLTWSEEFAKLCMIWLGFFAATVAHRTGDNIVITSFSTYFSAKVNHWLDLIVHILSCVFFVAMIVFGFSLARQQFHIQLPALRIPYAVMTIPVAVSGTLMLYHSLYKLVQWRIALPKKKEKSE